MRQRGVGSGGVRPRHRSGPSDRPGRLPLVVSPPIAHRGFDLRSASPLRSAAHGVQPRRPLGARRRHGARSRGARVRRPAPHLRRGRRAGDAPRARARRARRRSRRPRRAATSTTRSSTSKGCSPRSSCARSRSTSTTATSRTSCATSSTTPTCAPSCSTASSRRSSRRSARSLPELHTYLAVDDGTAPPPAGARRRATTRRRSRAASPARDFGPRSADDLYILYTGGTTGMPKGVMWRHEDVFFGAMGGAGGGGKPITTPEEIAERCREPRTRCVPGVPVHARHRALDGVQHAVHRRQRSSIPAEHRLDAARALGARRARAGELPGDRRRRVRPADARRARHRRRRARSTCRALRVLLSGGAILSPALKRALVERLPGVLVVDGYGASETGGQGQSVVVVGRRHPDAPRFRVADDTLVLDDDLRPAPAGRRRPPRAARPDPARLLQGPGEDRGDVPGRRRRALGGARRPRGRRRRRRDHAARPRLGLDQHRRREGVPRRGRVGAEGPRRRVRRGRRRRSRRALGRARRRGRAGAGRRARRRSTRCRTTRASTSRGYKVPRELVLVDAIARSPSGKPDYRWAKATAIDAPRYGRRDDRTASPARPARTSASTRDNPVDWYPWGDEAFARARAESKPIFLSVGYSSCHWCHVMAHESFEDAATAERHEPAVRQREGRPRGTARRRRDLHAGRAGAHRPRRLADERVAARPTAARSTAARTSPNEDRHGMPSFARVCEVGRRGVERAARRRRGAGDASSPRRSTRTCCAPRDGAELDAADPRRRAYANVRAQFEPQWGGFGRAPKFPQAMTIDFLCRALRAQPAPTRRAR